ncbi:MAG: efflux RND transporter permease subunit [Bacteroidota bacterium]
MNHKEFKITTWCLENKTTIYIFTFIISIAGLFTYNNLPKEQFPDIVVPTIICSTIYPGNSPADVENLITKPLEKQLKSVSGVKKVTSTSIADFSLITIEFNTGVDVPVARQRVSDAVDKAKVDLPTDMDEDPRVQEVDFSEFPIMNVNIAGDYPLDRLKGYAEDLQDEIEGLPEITRVDIIGALEREIQINVDLYRMQAAGISFSNIEQAVGAQNVNISGGELNVADVRRTLRVTGEFKDMEGIRNVIVRGNRGNSVFLKEIADVRDDFEEKQNFARLDHKSVITLNVIKRSGENLISASDKIEDAVHLMKANRFPQGLKITITGDQSETTRTSLNDLVNSVIIGFIFVVVVLMFFMGTTNAIFVGLSVPISILLAFVFMPGLDYSLNMIVMFSFLLALGIVVDDAIVVIENTHRIFHLHPERGVAQAAKEAAGEVFVPVLSGTLTTVAPFFPLLFWPGIVGEFMKYLPVTLIITLFASLFVAFVINPVFAVTFMKSAEEERNEDRSFKGMLIPLSVMGVLTLLGYGISVGVGNFMVVVIGLYLLNRYVFSYMIHAFQNRLLPAFMEMYRRMLRWVIQGFRPSFFLAGAFVMLIATFISTGNSDVKVNFFPESEPNFIEVYLVMPIGTDGNVTDSVTKIIEERVYQVIGENNPAVKSVITNVGIGAGDPQNPDRVVAPHKGKVAVAFKEFSKRGGVSSSDLLLKVRENMKGIPGAEITVQQEAAGPPTGKPVNIEIAGEEFSTLTAIEMQVKDAIRKANIAGIENLKSDLQLNKPEIIIDIDREKAAREGISTAQIALELRTALYGKEISSFRDAKDEYPIQLRVAPNERRKMEDLLNLQISFMDMATGRFRQVPLNALANLHYSTGYSSINRKNQERVISLSSNVIKGYNANEIVAQIKGLTGQMKLPQGYTVRLTGEQEDQAETGNFLVVAFGGALMLIFLILVTQFNSLVKPFIIFGTVILSLIGVLLGFVIFHMTFSIVMTGVGIIALAGIVVKNGILLIEFTDELRSRGFATREAIIEAGATRLTPVILTAAAAVLGLIPLAVGLNINFGTLLTDLDPKFYIGGDSGTFWGPLAWAIIFGLTFCTFLTLVIVPAMYWIMERTTQRFHKTGSQDTLEPIDHSVPLRRVAGPSH